MFPIPKHPIVNGKRGTLPNFRSRQVKRVNRIAYCNISASFPSVRG